MGGSSSVVNFYNNIVVGMQVGYNNDSPNLHLRNNIFYNSNHITEDGTEGTNQDNVTTSPNLADITMSSYQATDAILTASSIVAIDSGYQTGSYIPTDDYDENARSTIGIGAYEYGVGEEEAISSTQQAKPTADNEVIT